MKRNTLFVRRLRAAYLVTSARWADEPPAGRGPCSSGSWQLSTCVAGRSSGRRVCRKKARRRLREEQGACVRGLHVVTAVSTWWWTNVTDHQTRVRTILEILRWTFQKPSVFKYQESLANVRTAWCGIVSRNHFFFFPSRGGFRCRTSQ